MIQDFLKEIPGRYRGPGGAIAVLRKGEVVGKQVWGYSNLEEHRLMDEKTPMPICSITKQMLCLIIEDVRRNPTPKMLSTDRTFDEQMDAGLREIVSKEIIENTGLTLEHLCNNQSGIRDYWAMSMFWGTQPEGRFTLEHDAKKALSLTTSLQFEPGTQYSYCNLNFHILARVLENVTGLPLATHLSERLFAPARMQNARLWEDNARVSEWCVGYEGNEIFGFLPAKNLVEWSGDAGVLASLNDMIAYEQYLDRSWEDEQSIYRAIARVPYFKDGTIAMYGNGLARTKVGDIDIIGHGGSLRGYCLHRLQVPSERLAIVVMLNHEIDAETIAMDIVSNLLTTSQTTPDLAHRPPADWNRLGTFFDPDAQLSFTVRGDEPGTVIVQYADHEEKVFLSTAASGSTATLFLVLEGDTIEMHRIDDNRTIHARRIRAPQGIIRGDYTGRYECKEQESVFICDGTGEMLYGSFEGFLGKGPLHLMRYLGEDIWILVCPRGLDAPAPGNWTLVFHRDDAGAITGVTMGCWLARNVHFTKC